MSVMILVMGSKLVAMQGGPPWDLLSALFGDRSDMLVFFCSEENESQEDVPQKIELQACEQPLYESTESIAENIPASVPAFTELRKKIKFPCWCVCRAQDCTFITKDRERYLDHQVIMSHKKWLFLRFVCRQPHKRFKK